MRSTLALLIKRCKGEGVVKLICAWEGVHKMYKVKQRRRGQQCTADLRGVNPSMTFILFRFRLWPRSNEEINVRKWETC